MLRNASHNDFEFIFNLVVEGSREGHFTSDISRIPQAMDGFKLNLASILNSMRRLDTNGTAYGLVYEVKSKPVAFLMISSVWGNKGNEFWMASVAKEHRGAGYGSAMIDEVLAQFKLKGVSVLARCQPASDVMFEMLLRRGFKLEDTGPKGTRFLASQ